MFEIGFAELFLLGVIALLVVGPDRLPALARTVGVWVGRAQRLVGQVRADIEREVRADELRKAAKEYSPTAALSDMKKEMDDFASEVSKPVDLEAEKSGGATAEAGKPETGSAGKDHTESASSEATSAEADGSEEAAAATVATEPVAGAPPRQPGPMRRRSPRRSSPERRPRKGTTTIPRVGSSRMRTWRPGSPRTRPIPGRTGAIRRRMRSRPAAVRIARRRRR